MLRLGVLSLVLVATLASASTAADTPLLRGTVGPDFTISLIDANGAPVKQLDPGTYLIHIEDMSEFHNFRLTGPNVSQATSVPNIEQADWTVTFTNGATYTYLCDAHPATMKGTFTVGTIAPPPPPLPVPAPTPLKGSVGPGSKIAFARTAATGAAKITIRDLTAKDNFHLSGPGVNKKTGVAFKGTVTWTVTLKAGSYAFRSDAHPKLRGKLTVS
jgi:phage baseplate assembly protein gpV